MLEGMAEFFNNRVDSYDEHMLSEIEFAGEFYPFTAEYALSGRPKKEKRVLDLGCGTGLEMEYFYKLDETVRFTGIDLSEKMLQRLREKLGDKRIELICGSYFEVPFGENVYDMAVSVESLHHFSKEEKIFLYKKLHAALRDGAVFILTDYFASDDDDEKHWQEENIRLRREQGTDENLMCHYDVPLTTEHETQALSAGGFRNIRVIRRWENTALIAAEK